MENDRDELLSLEERRDLEGVIAGLPPGVREAAEAAYVEGRVAGLCREGALELAADLVEPERGRTGTSEVASGDR